MMINQYLRPHFIEPGLHEKASAYGVGMPIKKYQMRFLYLLLTILFIVLAGFVYQLIDSVHIYQAEQPLVQQIDNFYRHCTNCSELDKAKTLLEDHYTLEDAQSAIWRNALTLFLGLIAFWLCWSFRKEKLYLCSEGLLSVVGKKENAIRWDEIMEMSWSQGRSILVLRQSNGSEFCTPSKTMREDLQETIEREVIPRLLPSLLDRYSSNELLKFKDVHVSREGVQRGTQKVTWSEIEDVHGSQKAIVFNVRGKRWELKGGGMFAQESTNVAVCVALIKSILTQRNQAISLGDKQVRGEN